MCASLSGNYGISLTQNSVFIEDLLYASEGSRILALPSDELRHCPDGDHLERLRGQDTSDSKSGLTLQLLNESFPGSGVVSVLPAWLLVCFRPMFRKFLGGVVVCTHAFKKRKTKWLKNRIIISRGKNTQT